MRRVVVRQYVLLLSLLGGLLLQTAVQADAPVFAPADWQWQRVMTPASNKNAAPRAVAEYALVELDERAFANARADFADVRVIKSDNAPVPALVLTEAFKPTGRLRDDQTPAASANLRELISRPLAAQLTPLAADDPRGQPHAALTSGKRASRWLVDLGHYHQPVTHLELQTSAKNFQRRILVTGLDEPQPAPTPTPNDNQKVSPRVPFWFRVTEGIVQDVSTGQKPTRTLQLNFSLTRVRYLMLHVLDGDDQPLPLTGIQVFGARHHVLFRYDARESYRLFYGNSNASRPEYDLAALLGHLKLTQLPQFTLQAETANPAWHAPLAPIPEPARRSPLWVWVTLGVAALGLMALIYRLARMAGSTPSASSSTAASTAATASPATAAAPSDTTKEKTGGTVSRTERDNNA